MWRLYDRDDRFFGSYRNLEDAILVLSTGEIGIKWARTNLGFVGFNKDGAVIFFVEHDSLVSIATRNRGEAECKT